MYQLTYQCYRRKFRVPLVTGSGITEERCGIIVTLGNEDRRIAYGEIAPWAGFRTESIEAAETCLRKMSGCFSGNMQDIPEHLPCTRYALSCALADLNGLFPSVAGKRLSITALIRSQEAFRECYGLGFRSFKVKVGGGTENEEHTRIKALLDGASPECRFRLDANGSLDEACFRRYLDFLQDYADRIAFFEQPLPVGYEDVMGALGKSSSVKIALDESASSLECLKQLEASGWVGLVVVKPAFVGDVNAFMAWRNATSLPLVYSSAFETKIGLVHAMRVAASDLRNRFSCGFGTERYFVPDAFTSSLCNRAEVFC